MSRRSSYLMTFRMSWMWVSRSIDRLARCSRSPSPVQVGVSSRCPAAAISGCIFFHAQPADHAPWQTRKVAAMMCPHWARVGWVDCNTARQVVYTSLANFVTVIPASRGAREPIEIPRCATAHLRFALSTRPGMTQEIAMTTAALVLLFVGALAGGFVSGLAGFGTGLVALGIWLYVLPPSAAVPLVLICSVVAQTATFPSMWKSFDLTLVWPFLIGGLLGVPLGTMLVAHADPVVFKLTVGILLLVFPTALYFSAPMAFEFGGRIADGIIGFIGGILGGPG